MFGYHKKLLRADPTNRRIVAEELDETLIRKFLGDIGIGAKILYEETSPATEPFSAENVLMAVTGPFTGTDVKLPAGITWWRVRRSPVYLGNRMLEDPGLFASKEIS